MISPIPYRNIKIDTTLSPDKAASILSSALGSLRSEPSIFRWFQGNPRGFKGEVSNNGFTIKRVYPWWFHDSFLPVLYGRFTWQQHGTQVDVQITLRPLTIAIMTLFFVVGGYQMASSIAEAARATLVDRGFVSTLLIMLIGYALMIFSFNHHADIATDYVLEIFKKYRK